MSKQDQLDTNEVQTEESDENAIFVLDDIRVDTLGLVERGAVDETIFLMKNQGDPMSEEDEITTDGKVLNPLEQLGAERVQRLVDLGKKAEADTGDVEVVGKAKDKKKRKPMHTTKNLTSGAARGVRGLLNSYGEDLPTNVVSMLTSLLEDSEATMDEGGEEKTQKDHNGDEVTEMAKDEVKDSVTEEAVVKDAGAEQPPPIEPVTDPAVTELATRLEKAEKINADAMTRLEKAETELAKAQEIARQEREARERIVYIEKAKEFGGLAIDHDKMGGFLHSLATSDQTVNVEKAADAEDRSDLYDYITGVLKAANAQILESGFYKEVGSSKLPDTQATLVSKAEAAVKAGDYADVTEALLNASEQEQEAYLAKVRQ